MLKVVGTSVNGSDPDGNPTVDLGASTPNYKKMYERISDLARIGVWECHLLTEELMWTDTVYDLFGMPRGGALDRSEIVKLYEPRSRVELERRRAEAIFYGTGFCLDAQIQTINDGERWIRIIADVEQEAGQSTRIFGTKQDITAEKLAQDKLNALRNELIHVSRASAMETMASSLAHELNQPLGAAANYLAAARRMAGRDGASEDLTHALGNALESTHRTGEIIRRLRVMLSRRTTNKQKLSVHEVVGQAVLLATAGQEHISVAWELNHVPPIEADPIQIQQVLINLIKNACDAARSLPCAIEIKASVNDREIELCVVDSGRGIPSDILQRVFDPFATTKQSGMGLGLSIVRTIVEAHGGRVAAQNRSEGGAEVRLTLPISEHS
ncbi:GHKL domain-containing protein [Novosphingobium sp. G106]|uniref:sensor histidine kinase n=1 Tax=Novosphingobium sp. G106 TaxID=2849500 RepID=UPI001C2D0F90|nr:ATP-binding protein [Novosphingobium sp. G106]MBV1692330.1 GHKL domain-containing protein [Novosphingobium sp. G106]